MTGTENNLSMNAEVHLHGINILSFFYILHFGKATVTESLFDNSYRSVSWCNTYMTVFDDNLNNR